MQLVLQELEALVVVEEGLLQADQNQEEEVASQQHLEVPQEEVEVAALLAAVVVAALQAVEVVEARSNQEVEEGLVLQVQLVLEVLPVEQLLEPVLLPIALSTRSGRRCSPEQSLAHLRTAPMESS